VAARISRSCVINTNYALNMVLGVCKCVCVYMYAVCTDTQCGVRAGGRRCTSEAFSRFIPIRSLITWRRTVQMKLNQGETVYAKLPEYPIRC